MDASPNINARKKVPLTIRMGWGVGGLADSGQTLALLIAMVLFLFYPITRKRAEQTRQILDKRHHESQNNHAQS